MSRGAPRSRSYESAVAERNGVALRGGSRPETGRKICDDGGSVLLRVKADHLPFTIDFTISTKVHTVGSEIRSELSPDRDSSRIVGGSSHDFRNALSRPL